MGMRALKRGGGLTLTHREDSPASVKSEAWQKQPLPQSWKALASSSLGRRKPCARGPGLHVKERGGEKTGGIPAQGPSSL